MSEAVMDQPKADRDTVAHFREAWAEVIAGKTQPISELWDDIDASEVHTVIEAFYAN